MISISICRRASVQLLTCQTKSKLISWSLILTVEIAIVDINTFSEVVLRKVEELILWISDRDVILRLISSYSVGHLAGGRLITKEERNDCSASILARKMGEDYCGDVWVLNPCIHKANARVMDDNYSVCTLLSNIENDVVRVIVYASTLVRDHQ